jgi:hypothetical protein
MQFAEAWILATITAVDKRGPCGNPSKGCRGDLESPAGPQAGFRSPMQGGLGVGTNAARYGSEPPQVTMPEAALRRGGRFQIAQYASR